ncbi:hypothetical protein LV779_15720 [Streptomyces thinghirensis]|nr:hypothetical protein [Streptomyces thinghirensis]
MTEGTCSRPTRSAASGAEPGGPVAVAGPCAPAVPGAALSLLDAPGPGPAWAAGTPVGPAYAALSTTATMGAGLLDADDQALVRATSA